MATMDYQINMIADREFGRVTTPPANYFIALLTTIPNPNGTNAMEVSAVGTGYARQILPNNKTALTNSNNGQVFNVSAINYPAATANWGIVECVGIYDAPTGGNLLYISAQPTPKAYNTGDIAFFDIGDTTWTVQNIHD